MGINNVNTTTIERRFDMKSTQVAWITSSYDIASAVLGIVMGYLAAFHHKGRMMTVGAALLSLGSFVMFSPHLFVGNYNHGGGTGDDQCDIYGI
jgi:organic anion transporter 4A/organic anion transporter 4C